MSKQHREQFVAAAEEASFDAVHNWVVKHKSKADAFDLVELFQALPKNHAVRLWTGLRGHATKAIAAIQAPQADEQSAVVVVVPAECARIIEDISRIVVCSLKVEAPTVYPELRETLQVLHDSLLTIASHKVAEAVSKACERYFLLDLPQRNGIFPQTISYLLLRSLEVSAEGVDDDDDDDTENNADADSNKPSKSRAAKRKTKYTEVDNEDDATKGSTSSAKGFVRRVQQLKEGLTLIDFDDIESSQSIRTLLLRCYLAPVYLGSNDGCKLLAYAFTLSLPFVADIHSTIKNQLPVCSAEHVTAYGNLYFAAWQISTGPFLTRIEQTCLQDLMSCAVHASRKGLSSLSSVLRRVLSCWHSQKKVAGVDEMLVRLYDPIIWRSLSVANPAVRCNAAAILIDAFPLRNPEATASESDALLQKQIEALGMLLSNEPSPAVRCIAVQGSCRILSMYWDLLPEGVIRALLDQLTLELAFDSNSSGVRTAVVQGLGFLLNNHLAQATVKQLLPRIRNLIHDTAEQTRVAMLDLLLLIKKIRTIRFWDVVPVNHLLARLESEASVLSAAPAATTASRRIVELLSNSYFPEDKEPEARLTRCIALVTSNRAASRQFYRFLHAYVPLPLLTTFIMHLCRYVHHAATGASASAAPKESQQPFKDISNSSKKTWRRGDAASATNDQDWLTESGGVDDPSATTVSDESMLNISATTDPLCEETGDAPAAKNKTGKAGKGKARAKAAAKSAGKAATEETTASSADTTADAVVENPELIQGLLEVVVICWRSIRSTLAKPRHAKLQQALVVNLKECLPAFMKAFSDGPCSEALIHIAAQLPREHVPTLCNEIILPQLEAIAAATAVGANVHHPSASDLASSGMQAASLLSPLASVINSVVPIALSSSAYSQMAPLIDALCAWDQVSVIVDTISNLLTPGDAVRAAPKSARSSSKSAPSGKKAQAAAAASTASTASAAPSASSNSRVFNPVCALSMLHYILTAPNAREALSQNPSDLLRLLASLDACAEIESVMVLGALPARLSALQPTTALSVLLQMLIGSMRCAIHLRRAQLEDVAAPTVDEDVVTLLNWARQKALPMLVALKVDAAKPRAARQTNKRKAETDAETNTEIQGDIALHVRIGFGADCLNAILSFVLDLVTVGIVDGELIRRVCRLTCEMATAGILPAALGGRLLLEMTTVALATDRIPDCDLERIRLSIGTVLDTVLNETGKRYRDDDVLCQQELSALRPFVVEAFNVCQQRDENPRILLWPMMNIALRELHEYNADAVASGNVNASGWSPLAAFFASSTVKCGAAAVESASQELLGAVSNADQFKCAALAMGGILQASKNLSAAAQATMEEAMNKTKIKHRFESAVAALSRDGDQSILNQSSLGNFVDQVIVV
ncbi:hypothetical protein CAOG_04613 [Capsaspora owczarzaki ATCC 30864]|uniref:Uncharacterized protein n=1 Tax=Capsaspora owczarzaki (strain ATCC 30864) TaxID=595528 RepID=A0A0D2WQE8_CAPO3|nr:hypothetical protein CAOG_04613 [Capsaspora owczarzaki ATCC 30864]KJE93895.1 hypothetical protein CAOG_004613 [Capsaspora owczarzaki ATCC 30864]|eukprot:XP_004347360.2 hypothetical protein CAOG_04613 [Capsaspora owczarzaki ATCC 30864]